MEELHLFYNYFLEAFTLLFFGYLQFKGKRGTKMDNFENSIKKFQEIFKKSKVSDQIDIKNILLVLDETKERKNFIFNLLSQFFKSLELFVLSKLIKILTKPNTLVGE